MTPPKKVFVDTDVLEALLLGFAKDKGIVGMGQMRLVGEAQDGLWADIERARKTP